MAPIIAVKNISFVLMHFAYFIADPCETNFLFFFLMSRLSPEIVHSLYLFSWT